MSIQIVTSGNRVLAHGTGFSVSGDTVENESTSRIYKNATITTVDSVPDDIDSVGYEYHAGRFVPCGPFGIGKGNVAVLCNEDCKALKDSGIPMEDFAASEYTTYRPKMSDSGVSLTFNIKPDVIFITGDSDTGKHLGIILGTKMLCVGDEDDPLQYKGEVEKNENTVSWSFTKVGSQFGQSNVTYHVYAFSVKGA